MSYVQVGTRRVTVTYWSMTPQAQNVPARNQVQLRTVVPTVSFYRYLYEEVGSPWNWTERKLQSDQELKNHLLSSQTVILVLYSDGVPAGFGELILDSGHKAELKYFGLCQDFIGQGLGRLLLSGIINEAYTRGIKELWLHTSSADSEAAQIIYQKAGFIKTATREEDDPVLEQRH